MQEDSREQENLERTIDQVYQSISQTWNQAEYEYQKYANIDPNKILEENLILSNDRREAIFKITEEKEQ